MGKFVNPGNGSFQVALNSEIYVDKTGLIRYTNKVINTLQGYICNSRPRRFGKSITADMLTAYYSRGCDSLDMFSTLEIADSPDFDKHLNKYDVIHLDIGWFLEHADSPDNVVRFVTHCVLKELKEYYPASGILLKDAAYLDFLGLPEKYSETKLRKGIVAHMKDFIFTSRLYVFTCLLTALLHHISSPLILNRHH